MASKHSRHLAIIFFGHHLTTRKSPIMMRWMKTDFFRWISKNWKKNLFQYCKIRIEQSIKHPSQYGWNKLHLYPVVNASSTGMNLVDSVTRYKFGTKEPGIKYLKESIKKFNSNQLLWFQHICSMKKIIIHINEFTQLQQWIQDVQH